MTRSDALHRQPQQTHREWIGGGVGAILGFALGALIYILLTPVLEASPGFIRELQGLSWNLVPGLTVLGAVLGWMFARRR